MTTSKDFEEITHCGGRINFHITTNEEGQRSYRVRYTIERLHSARLTLFAVYALPEGIPIEIVHFAGDGEDWSPPPLPSCLLVLIACDEQGYFGHKCPECEKYWRSGPIPRFCPYCAFTSDPFHFFSDAQARYVHHYCRTLAAAMDANEDGEITISMDDIVDAADTGRPIPTFFAAEESQQNKFNCSACREFNDILGRFGYCSQCGMRNDLDEFENHIIPEIREHLNSGSPPEKCLRQGVASFESLLSRIAKELAARIPLSSRRAKRLAGPRFHDLTEVAQILGDWFDIDICTGMSQQKWKRTVLKFHRRHVYEHNEGEVDQKYLDDSGDNSVRLKQRILEKKQDTHKLLGCLVQMARNLHKGFHMLFPPTRTSPVD